MHFRQIALLFALIFISMSICFAQPVKKDAVYLMNGSILRGKIIENVIGKYIKIEMIGSSILVIPEQEIDHIILREALPVKQREAKQAGVEVFPAITFYGGSSSTGGFTTVTSYRFPFRLSAGAGIGIEWFKTAGLPVFADIKYSFLKGSITPFVYSQAGYTLPLAKNQDGEYMTYHGGPLFGAGVGLRKNFTNRNAFIFSLGYRYQQTRTTYDNNYYYWGELLTERIDRYNRIAFTIGFLFD
jgi:hypothetical protein